MVAVAPNTRMVACQQRAEQQARQNGLGVWRELKPGSPQSLRRGGFALLEGRVERVERNRGGYWLEMDGPGSEEHTSALQSLMRISYDVFCLKNKTTCQHHFVDTHPD